MSTRPHRALLLALLVSAAALAGCSSGSSDASSSSGSSTGGAGVAAAETRSAASGAAAPPDAAAPAAAAGPSLYVGHDVLRTATQCVLVADVRAAAEQARGVAEAAGGGLEGEDAGDGRDVLRLRVAPDRVTAVLDTLARLGREQSRTVGSTDVTEQVADLDSRLASQRASVERVRALLAGAKVLADVVTIEGQLAQRQSELESLEARAKALHGSADLATVTLTLSTAPAPVPPPSTPELAGFGSGLAAGVHAVVATARVAAVVGGALLPFLPLLLLAAWLLRRHLQRPARQPLA